MAGSEGGPDGDRLADQRAQDPATEDRADYDYAAGPVERPDLVAALRERVDGDVRFDELTRQLYATDASAYEVTPVGVVFPTDTADVSAVVGYCAGEGVPVLPRGGGTSLAGQAVNEAVVLDFTRYMDGFVGTDLSGSPQTATAQPGITLARLNDHLADEECKFAPDPAWGDKSALGGAIGNNSTGAHSLVYGKTDAYIESCEVVLADGTVTRLGEVSLPELREVADPDTDELLPRIYAAVARIVDEEADAVEAAFPDLKRTVSGYDLDRLVADAERGSVNLARLLAGSEGTLAVVTEATVALEPVPATKAMGLLAYPSLEAAMADVPDVLAHDPAAVEALDDVLLDLAADTQEFGDLVATLVPEGAEAVLLVEFYADNDPAGKQLVADLLADRVGDVATAGVPQEGAEHITAGPVRAIHGDEAHDAAERERFWKLRKSGLPILLGRTSDAKHVSFVEDTAVPPEHLDEYVADVREILAAEGTFASFYAHAGPGCLHIRPLVNTKTVEGLETMVRIADRVTDLVVEYGGSVSGEHGDGRARTQWNRKLYGDHVWSLFSDLKTAFDPDWLLNPGQVCGDVTLDEHLRFDPDYEFAPGSASDAASGSDSTFESAVDDEFDSISGSAVDDEFDPAAESDPAGEFGPAADGSTAIEPTLEWQNENGFQGMVELCHGCGGCRGDQDTTGGVMCPTFRASREESTSTRGRANALRQAINGDLGLDAADPEFATEVMDLCVGCKGCKRDCPSEVDLAKLKAEVQHARHQDHGASVRERLFANVHRLSHWGSRLAPVSNWLQSLPGADLLAERILGIARERSLPTYERESFTDWFGARGPAVDVEDARRRALLVPDSYNEYTDPSVLRDAVAVLEGAGVHVDVPDGVGATGRAAHSQGFLDLARERARETVATLAPRVADGWDVVLAEPSDAVMLQSDYLDLLGGPDVDRVADSTFGVCEYLDETGLAEGMDWAAPDEPLTYHGHCHQTAVKREHHAVSVLRRAGYAVDPVDSTCCGMAGSFGYEAEHYSMSQAIGRILFDQVADAAGETVVTPGASCRTQLGDRRGHPEPPHPVTCLARALPE